MLIVSYAISQGAFGATITNTTHNFLVDSCEKAGQKVADNLGFTLPHNCDMMISFAEAINDSPLGALFAK